MTFFDTLLNNDFIVYKRLQLPDGQGGWYKQFTAMYDTVAGRIRPVTAKEREVAMQQEWQISHILYTNVVENIERGDIVSLLDGSLYVEIMGVREPSMNGHHLEIDCLERQYETIEGLE